MVAKGQIGCSLSSVEAKQVNGEMSRSCLGPKQGRREEEGSESSLSICPEPGSPFSENNTQKWGARRSGTIMG